jgi:RNA polymerase sigma factor (sigma-70 family)
MEEQDAIARLRRGGIGGLEWLVRCYQTPALRAATLVTRDRPLAEDVVQAAFLRAYERIGQFAPDRPFGPWFRRSVVNAAARAAARQARQVSLDGDADGDAETPVRQLRDPGRTPEALVDRAEWAIVRCMRPSSATGDIAIQETTRHSRGGYAFPAAGAEDVTVNGHPATYVHGSYDGDGQWDSNVDVSTMSWDADGITYVLSSEGLGLGRADLLRVANSIR